MNIRNVSADARYIPVLDLEVAAGEVFDVLDADIAASLLDQPANWAADDPSEED